MCSWICANPAKLSTAERALLQTVDLLDLQMNTKAYRDTSA